MIVQRIVVSFSKGEEIKYISHLDLMRLWMRAFSRSEIPVGYSQGFSPHPKLALGAPLAVGVTSECELLDLQLETRLSLGDLFPKLAGAVPPGVEVKELREIPIESPSLQSKVHSARYRVLVTLEMDPAELRLAIDKTMAAQSLPRTRIRDGKPKSYDLRPLIHELVLENTVGNEAVLAMTLRQDNAAAGRPQEVAAQLGFTLPPVSVHRIGLMLGD